MPRISGQVRSNVFLRRLSAPLSRYAAAAGVALASAAISAAALIAVGAFGPIRIHIAGPADSALVVDTLRHAFLGCLLTLLQWAAGGGIVLLIGRNNGLPFGRVALVGFPFSLVLLAALVTVALALPFGIIIAVAGLVACLFPLARWRPQPNDLARTGKIIFAIFPLAVIFGCWWGFYIHGPTPTLYGRSPGDVVFYASSIAALRLHHFPIWYLGNEGESHLPFNLLFPALGAALLPYIHLDPFLFILAAGGSSYVLSLGIALYAFLSTRLHRRPEVFTLAIVALAVIVAGYNPYWTVGSIPVVFTVPLTIAIWYQVQESKSGCGIISNFGLAVVGSMLSKVASAATLGPLALAPVIGQIKTLSRTIWIVGAIVVALAAACALALVTDLGPLMLEAAAVGPDSYTNWWYGYGSGYDWPFLLRDIGSLLLIALAFRLSPWPIAASLALGLILALGFAFFMRINFACAAVILGLLFVEKSDKRELDVRLAATAFGLCLPAMLTRDFSGYPGGFFWLLCVGGTVWIVLANVAPLPDAAGKFAWLKPAVAFRTAAVVSIVAMLCLVAVARGSVVLDPGDRNALLQISPDARDIWLAVRHRTPPDALIFTDQTGPEPGLLTGWNTFALSGERQIYLAGWYQSAELRISRAKRAERLAINSDVLSGRRPPISLSYSRKYSSYFAVVQRSRAMPPEWQQQYANSSYALYRYEPNWELCNQP